MNKKDVEKYFKGTLIPEALRAASDTLQGDDTATRQKMVDSVLDRAGIARKQENDVKTEINFNIPLEYLQKTLTAVQLLVEENHETETMDGKGVDRD